MVKLAEDLAQSWRSQLAEDCPDQSAANQESIIRWLLGDDLERFEQLNQNQLEVAQQAMAYRYRILRQRYLGIGPERAYRYLLTRLGSSVLLRNKIRAWVASSRDRQRAVADVLQEVLQELLQSDRYMQQQITWIAECTTDARLRNALLFASTEEYCLRPIRNQPLLVYRFVNYLQRSQRGGLTQVPIKNSIRLVSEQVLTPDCENSIDLLNTEAVTQYQGRQATEEQQVQRIEVQQKFEQYLAQKLGQEAVQWLQLYLQGRSQEEIASRLNLPVRQIYRLREKISYHAVRVFALNIEPELIGNWLETSLKEHGFGLTPQQWQQFRSKLTPRQHQLCEQVQAGKNLETIAQELQLKTPQLMGEWSKIYLAAQTLRSDS
ncbi:MAG: helix-turn-helix domain-containing protein [Chroococcidiopsidaceae cyanobacterium CP_BM_RX_35]|nr:helix-turn-helix domain-containing protein [Chroococcidiopsidaceae cyanobacterium CP_BM_RX_35]